MKQRVIIMGAGIGGLTVAHELSKHEDIEITIVERNNEVGGQARTKQSQGDHSEYCWHAISSGYNNLPYILKDLDILSHLQPIQNYEYVTSKRNISDTSGENFLTGGILKFYRSLKEIDGTILFKDMIKGLWFRKRIQWMCDERVDSLDKITWSEFSSSFSPKLRRWIVDSTSIYLGMEYDKLSAQCMIDLLRHNSSSFLEKDFYAFDGPMQEVWFDPWVSHLKQKGVQFLLNSTIERVCTVDDVITHVLLDGGDRLDGDIFINGLDTKSLQTLIPRKSFAELHETAGTQIQTQVLFKFPYRLPQRFNTVYIFHESPWFLMARHEGSFWNLKDKDYLSCGIGMWNVPGINGKTALECTREELAQECWLQMKMVGEMPNWDIWDSFVSQDGIITTYEPKFSNNAGSLSIRPEARDEIFVNLLHATSYTKTEMNIFNMDSAVEAGMRAAQVIKPNEIIVSSAFKPVSRWLRWIRRIDKFIFKMFRSNKK